MASREELRAPKKKKGADKLQQESPFPIPIASLTGRPASKERWYHYFGRLRGDMVAVDRLGDMTFLYKMVGLVFVSKINLVYRSHQIKYADEHPKNDTKAILFCSLL